MFRRIASILLLLASTGLVAGGPALRWLHRSCDVVHHAAADGHDGEHHGHAERETHAPDEPASPTDGDCIKCLVLDGLVTPQADVSTVPTPQATAQRLDAPEPKSVPAPRPPRVAGARPPPQA